MTTSRYSDDGPRPVPMVPQPWRPYMDGQIWEFTQEQFRSLPPLPGPMYDSGTGEVFGMRAMTWVVLGKHYVRFFDGPTDPEVLAGWKTPTLDDIRDDG